MVLKTTATNLAVPVLVLLTMMMVWRRWEMLNAICENDHVTLLSMNERTYLCDTNSTRNPNQLGRETCSYLHLLIGNFNNL